VITLHRDFVFGLAVLAVAIVVAVVSFGYAADSSWFPRVLSIFLGMMAVLLLFRSRKLPAVAASADQGQLAAALHVLAAGIVYALLIQVVSIEIATYVLLVGAMYFLGQRNAVVIALVATITMLLIKLLFFVMLDVSR
jgi:hypothetical protein